MADYVFMAQWPAEALVNIVMFLWVGLFFAYLPLQIVALIRLRGGWRMATNSPLPRVVEGRPTHI